MEIVGFLVACWVCIVLARRAPLYWRRKRGGLSPRTRMTGVAVGNALQMLQAFVQPQVRYVIREQLQERAEEDEGAEPKDAREHLLRQARRIQRGEEVGQITALLSPHVDDCSSFVSDRSTTRYVHVFPGSTSVEPGAPALLPPR